MKFKFWCFVTAALVQPMLWWSIYIMLRQVALKNNSEMGLGFVCMVSALLCICLFVAVSSKYEK